MSSQFSYTVVMMNMNLLAVVIPLYIYHGCSTWKTSWEEKFTSGEKLFLAVKMKIVVIVMLGKTMRSRVVTNMSPRASL